MAKQKDPYKQKYRPDMDSALDREIDAALGDVSIEDLYDRGGEEPRPKTPASKNLRHGKIVSVGKDDVIVDFGGKDQGVAPLAQFEQEPKVGDVLEFHVDRYDSREGLLMLSLKGAAAANVSWETLEEGQIVEGMVTGVNKGGLELQVKSMRAFMPAGQVDLYHVADLSVFLNQKLTAEVMQCDPSSRNLVLSRRNVLEREREAAKEKLMAELSEGQTRRGTVRNVMDFGAFVDLGGVDGLLHVSEMSFRRLKHPGEMVKVGDAVDVKIVKIDKETGKLSLSLKQARPDPWLDVAGKYPVGATLTGRVSRVEAFGAFIEVEEGVEGLLPVSEMSWQRIRHPSDVVKEGDTLKLVILSVDPVARRMSFSLKQAGPDPWSRVNERYATHTIVEGIVTRVVDFGAFVELEAGLEGLVHISELASQRVRSAGDVAKVGQKVRVQILEIDKENRRMALSLKAAQHAEGPAASGAAPAPAPPKKKRPPLRGGLDF